MVGQSGPRLIPSKAYWKLSSSTCVRQFWKLTRTSKWLFWIRYYVSMCSLLFFHIQSLFCLKRWWFGLKRLVQQPKKWWLVIAQFNVKSSDLMILLTSFFLPHFFPFPFFTRPPCNTTKVFQLYMITKMKLWYIFIGGPQTQNLSHQTLVRDLAPASGSHRAHILSPMCCPAKISPPLKIKDESEGVRHHHHQHGCHLFSSSNNIGLCSPITIFFHPDHFILILRNTKAMENFGMDGTHLWLKPHVLWQHEVLQVLVPEHFSFCIGIAHQSKQAA